MKALFMMAIAALAFGFSAQAQSDTIPPMNRDQKMKTMKQRDEKMWKDLNLTQDQNTQIQTVRKDYMNQRQAIRDDSSLTTDQKQQKYQDLMMSENDKINSLLTPDQQAKWKAWKQKNNTPAPMQEMKINRPVIKDTM